MTAFQAILRQLCPRCRAGRIYGKSGINGECPSCGLRFKREPGYFVGAMYVSFAISLPVVVSLVVSFWLLAHLSYEVALGAAAVTFLPCIWFIVRMSRVIWIHLDRTVDPN